MKKIVDSKQLEQLKAQLLEDKKEIQRRLNHSQQYDLQYSMGDSIKEFSLYDNHPADIGTEMYEREKDMALNQNDKHHLQQIEEAFQAMAKGMYGICLTCGKEIPFERLEAQPTAKYCVEHALDDHVSQDRPVSEEFLQPPFGRTSMDKKDDETEFDGEDSWQAVAKYGTSDPADFFHDAFNYNEMYIESDEPIGYVDQVEGFIVTDITGGAGENYDVVKNKEYQRYVDRDEGEGIVRGDEDKGWD